MKFNIEMYEIPNQSTTTEPNKYKIVLYGIGTREEIESYYNWLKDNPKNRDLEETKYGTKN